MAYNAQFAKQNVLTVSYVFGFFTILYILLTGIVSL